MAKYSTDFSSQTVDAAPSGWTLRYETSAGQVMVRTKSGTIGGKVLRIEEHTTNGPFVGATLDAVDADADRANAEVLAIFSVGTNAANTVTNVLARASGTLRTNATFCGATLFGPSSAQKRAVRRVSGSATTLQSSSYTTVVDRRLGARVRANGDTVSVRIWEYDLEAEPETYPLSGSISTVSAAGWIGFFAGALLNSASKGPVDLEYFSVGTNGDAAPPPGAASEPIAFSGTVPAQSFAEDAAITPLDLSTYFSGDLTPFSYAVTTGTLPAGLSLNSSTGVISGTPTTPASAVSIVVTATDDDSNTAAANAFNITITEAATAMTLVTDIDAGNVSQGSTTITGADTSEPVVNLAHRPDADVWRHLFFAVENAAGKRPIFKAPRSTRYTNSDPSSEYRPVWTQDFITWTRAPSRTLTGGTSGTIDWQFTDPLPAGRVYIATQPLGRQADAVALTTRLLTEYPSVASPTASADAGGVFFTSPAETDGIGRAVGGNPMYAIDLKFGGSTTDGGPKRKLVVIAGIHAAGEATSWIPFMRFLDFVLDSADAAAVSLRANWDISLYYNITPNGVYSGDNRTNPSRGSDPNRIWDAPNVEIAATQAAILADIDGGRFDAFFSWHAWSSETNPFLMYLTPTEASLATRGPVTQAFITLGTTIFGGSPSVTSSGTNNTDVWWAETNGAAVAIDTEVQQNGSTASSTYQHIGESWAKTLQAVDAAGEFWAPSETAAGEVAALSLSAPAGTTSTSTSASATLALLSLTAPAGDATTASTTFASGNLAALSIAAPNGTSTAQAAVSAGIQALSLTAPAGDASSASTTFASGDVAPVSLAAPDGTTAQSTASSGAVQHIILTAPNGNASTVAETLASGAVAGLTLTPSDGAQSVSTAATGAPAGITLLAVEGDANTLTYTLVEGDLAPITLTAPTGTCGVDVAGQGAMAGVVIVAPVGRGFDPTAAGETVLGYATRTREGFVVTRTKDYFVRAR